MEAGEAPMADVDLDHNKGYEFIGFKVRKELVSECMCGVMLVCDVTVDVLYSLFVYVCVECVSTTCVFTYVCVYRRMENLWDTFYRVFYSSVYRYSGFSSS